MNEYEVEWSGAKKGNPITHIVKANNEDEAFALAVSEHKFPGYPEINMMWGWGGCNDKRFKNPHYDAQCTGLEKIEAKPIKESRLQQPARSDGSIRWFERIEGASLTQNEILLAQLTELRIIKQCVVGTVVLVIVIPSIVGVIISG